MRCEPFRQAISARMDGEDPALSPDALDHHLRVCPDCRAFETASIALHRRVRVRAADAVPDLSEAILRAASTTLTDPARRRTAVAPNREWARYALLVVALTQLVIAVPPLLLGEQSGATIHLARELGAWDVALGVGWLLVAWSPRRAAGLLPFTTALAAVMVGTAALDAFDGRVPLLGEAHHLLDLAGLAMIWLLARATPSDRSLVAFRHVRARAT